MMRIFTRTLLGGAVALALVGCSSSSKDAAAPVGGSAAPSALPTTIGRTASAGVSTTTAGNGADGNPKATGAFCADVRDGAVSTAMADAADPTAAGSSLDQLKKIDGEAPSEIKSSMDAMVQLLTQIHNAGTDSAKEAALAAGGAALQTAATSIGSYITDHCQHE